jgi:uncharacterized DUF497 family protein
MVDRVHTIAYTRSHMRYDWDDIKYETNIKKHGIRFEQAETVFADAMAIEYHDQEHSTKEENRYIRIGMSVMGVLVVVFCERVSLNGEEITRIISARKAEPIEVDKYYEN